MIEIQVSRLVADHTSDDPKAKQREYKGSVRVADGDEILFLAPTKNRLSHIAAAAVAVANAVGANLEMDVDVDLERRPHAHGGTTNVYVNVDAKETFDGYLQREFGVDRPEVVEAVKFWSQLTPSEREGATASLERHLAEKNEKPDGPPPSLEQVASDVEKAVEGENGAMEDGCAPTDGDKAPEGAAG